ncbi:hypothetical protein GG344DRAFT_83318 [Lentinula edodes]|nr:hypothetical protein GG344DRAFT_83318 [Lentinula edodes]
MYSAPIERFSTSRLKEGLNTSMDKVDCRTLTYTLNHNAYRAPNNDHQTTQYSALYTAENRPAETYSSRNTAAPTNPSLTLIYGTGSLPTTSYDECSIPTNDAPMPYLFHNKFPDTIDVLILQRCGLKEWTILKRLSQFHYHKITTFIDARFLLLLERYVNKGIPLLTMLHDSRSVIAGQFLFKFLNLFMPNRTTDPPLLIFAPNGTQQTWLLFAQLNQMDGCSSGV